MLDSSLTKRGCKIPRVRKKYQPFLYYKNKALFFRIKTVSLYYNKKERTFLIEAIRHV